VNIVRRFAFHPLVFAVFPVLALLAVNITQVKAWAALRSLAVSLSGALILWEALYLLLKDRLRSSLVCTWLLMLFFSYGHIYSFLSTHPVGGFFLSHHRILVPVWLGLALLGSWWFARRLKDLDKVTLFFNWMGLEFRRVLFRSWLWWVFSFSRSVSLRQRPVLFPLTIFTCPLD
jgi:hypothetical protein